MFTLLYFTLLYFTFVNLLYTLTVISIFVAFGLYNFLSWTAQAESWTALNLLDCKLKYGLLVLDLVTESTEHRLSRLVVNPAW